MPNFNLNNLTPRERNNFSNERELLWRSSFREFWPDHLEYDYILQTSTSQTTIAASSRQNPSRIWFRDLRLKQGESGWQIWQHPKFGVLPMGWEYRLCDQEETEQGGEAEGKVPMYFNTLTGKTQTGDPRGYRRFLEKRNEMRNRARKEEILRLPEDVRPCTLLAVSDARTKAEKGKYLSKHYVHQEVGRVNERCRYETLHTIDDGKGGGGAMNGGIFVVRLKGDEGGPLVVEKRFKKEKPFHSMAKEEITMLHKLFHPSISMYIDGFWTEKDASLYVEFCDRGDLSKIVTAYEKKSAQKGQDLYIPEAFIWHVFVCLLDALTYLQLGRTPMDCKQRKDFDFSNKPESGWIPIVHRDLKLDNVLLRSRNDPASEKYFYCVISDFGLAVEDRECTDSLCEYSHKNGGQCGTSSYFAPELCHNPYSTTDDEETYFPERGRHSAKSDLWALAAIAHNLCTRDGDSHFDWAARPKEVSGGNWLSGRASRRLPLPDIPASQYSRGLDTVIKLAGEESPKRRPSPPELLKRAYQVGEKGGWHLPEKRERLPNWATKVHGLYANEARPSE